MIDGQKIKDFSGGILESQHRRFWSYVYDNVPGPATHEIKVCANCDNRVSDSNSKNNCKDFTLKVREVKEKRKPNGPPDFVVSNLTLDKNPCVEGDDVVITFFVINQGIDYGDECTACLIIDGETVKTFAVPENFHLYVGKSVVWSYTYKATKSITNAHNIKVCADCENNVVETDESNNCLQKTLNLEQDQDCSKLLEDVYRLIDLWKADAAELPTVVDAINKWASCDDSSSPSSGSKEQQKAQLMAILQAKEAGGKGN
jgi:predicted metal-binding protein